VVIAARAVFLFLRPSHVNGIYMRPEPASMLRKDQD
jgi:hypothetical protein